MSSVEASEVQVDHARPGASQSSGGSRPVLIALGTLVVPVSVGGGVVLSTVATSLSPLVILLPLGLIVPLAIWRDPRIGVYLLFAAAVTIEQFPVVLGEVGGPVTAFAPMFRELVPGLAVNGVEAVAVITLGTVILQSVRDRCPWALSSGTLGLLTVLLMLAVGFLLVGWSRGGDTTKALWEVRPLFYLAVAFLLASLLLTSVQSLQPLLWTVVVGCGAKASYGVLLWFSVRDMNPRPEAVLAHEESFFFGLYVFTVLALWLFKVRGLLRAVATLLLPIVLLADLVNGRRTAWLVLAIGTVVLIVVAYVRLPDRRGLILKCGLLAAIVAAAYLPLYWDHAGALAGPARAVRSQFDPDPRDASSNAYRELEDENLREYIRSTSSTGLGFGVALSYRELPDLSETNEIIRYVPHNSVLWLWVRMGVVGIVLWLVFLAHSMTLAVRLGRMAPDNLVAAFGATVGAGLMGYAAMGLVDLGFFWFRNAIAMGVLLGATQALLRRTDDSTALSAQPSRSDNRVATTRSAPTGGQ